MKSNRHSMNIRGFVYFVGVMIVLFLMTPANVSADCYKYLTFKNEGGYVAKANVSYVWNNYDLKKSTGNITLGHEERLGIPCAATKLMVEASTTHQMSIIRFFTIKKAEDRCFLLKGTASNQSYASCDPPGTPPLFDNTCWKHVTLKHEGAYVAKYSVMFTLQSERASKTEFAFDSEYYNGQTRRIEVPCSSDYKLSVDTVPNNRTFVDRKLEPNKDHCIMLKGTYGSPRYEFCAVAGEQRYNIALRNYGAYATDLWVTYDFKGERLTHKSTIQTQKTGGTTIPLQATKVHVKAKAVAGETIFSKDYPTAQNLCYEVRGSTLITRWAYCTP